MTNQNETILRELLSAIVDLRVAVDHMYRREPYIDPRIGTRLETAEAACNQARLLLAQ